MPRILARPGYAPLRNLRSRPVLVLCVDAGLKRRRVCSKVGLLARDAPHQRARLAPSRCYSIGRRFEADLPRALECAWFMRNERASLSLNAWMATLVTSTSCVAS